MVEAVRNHIKSFPHYESHYCRKTSKNVRYLPQKLNMSKMYRMYKQEQIKCGITSVSESKYKQVFRDDFNLKFKKPKKDTCNKCDNFRIQLEAKKDIPDEYQQVLAKKNEHYELQKAARDTLISDREAAKDPNNKCQVITFDLQSVLQTPQLTSNAVFYKRQLSVYNLGIHECREEKGIMHVWHEGIASRGAQEISSCIRNFVKSPICNRESSELVAWSDSCGGQNRNIKMAVCLLNLVLDVNFPYTVITQKFLVSGHSFLPNDSDFGDIEKQAKFHPNIYTPSEWYDIMKDARVASCPFQVVEMFKEDFLSTKELEKTITNRKVTVDKLKLNWLNMRQIQVRRSDPASLFFRDTFDEVEPWKEINIKRRGKNVADVIQTPLHNAPKCITAAKKKDILSLLELVPPRHHQFYRDLNDKENGRDDDVQGLPAVLDFDLEFSDDED